MLEQALQTSTGRATTEWSPSIEKWLFCYAWTCLLGCSFMFLCCKAKVCPLNFLATHVLSYRKELQGHEWIRERKYWTSYMYIDMVTFTDSLSSFPSAESGLHADCNRYNNCDIKFLKYHFSFTTVPHTYTQSVSLVTMSTPAGINCGVCERV